MAIQNPEKVAERQRKRHPKAFRDGEVLYRLREFQKAEMDRFGVPRYRRRYPDPPPIRVEEQR